MDKYINNIHHNDAINFLTKLPDNSIDVVITDPPYNFDNRDYIGVEIDGGYVSIARKYLDNIETKPEIVTKELQDNKETKLEDF